MKKLTLLLIGLFITANVSAGILSDIEDQNYQYLQKRQKVAGFGKSGINNLKVSHARAFNEIWGDGCQAAMDFVNAVYNYPEKIELFTNSIATNEYIYAIDNEYTPMVAPCAPDGVIIDGQAQYFDANGDLAVVVPTVE